MSDHGFDYDLLVVGSGPGGQRAAVAAAKLGHKVAVVDRRTMVGGVCINTGTIPSKTLREAVLYLTGMSQRDLYGASYRVKNEITIADLTARTQHVIGREVEVVRNQLLRNHIHLIAGTAEFSDPHTVTIHGPDRLSVSAMLPHVSAKYIGPGDTPFNFLPVHAGLYRSYRESRRLPSAWGWHLAIRREA